MCEKLWRVISNVFVDNADYEFVVDVIASSENAACTKAFQLWRNGKRTSEYSIFIMSAVNHIYSDYHKEWYSRDFNCSAEYVLESVESFALYLQGVAIKEV